MPPKISLDKVKETVFTMNALTLSVLIGFGVTAVNKWEDLASIEYVDTALVTHNLAGVHPAAQIMVDTIELEIEEVNKGLDFLTERAARQDVEELQGLVCEDQGNIGLQNELSAALDVYREITGVGFPPGELGC